MSAAIKNTAIKVKALLATRRGRNAMIFCCFVLLSAVLWVVQSLSEETQTDLRCSVVFYNVPDSVTRISPLPKYLDVTVRARGTQLLKYSFSGNPQVKFDFNKYRHGNCISLSESTLKGYFREIIGSGCQIQSVSPDSLIVYFTTKPGVKLPVIADLRDDGALPNGYVRNISLSTDTVEVYTMDGKVGKTKSISTTPISLSDIVSSQTLKVGLLAPKGARVIPDSVDIHFDVVPLVSYTLSVEIKARNVPEGKRLILIPSKIDVYFMAPGGSNRVSATDLNVYADYRSINPVSGSVAVRLGKLPEECMNVFISADSVEYLIEQ